MPTDDTAPATKKDLSLLEERMTVRFDQKLTASEDRIKRHFDVAVETIRHDLLGANADEIDVLKDRIARVEQHVGLTPR